MVPISNTTLNNTSIFRKMNPSLKFIAFFACVLIFFIPAGFFGQIILTVFILGSLFIAKLSKATYFNLLKTFLIMLIMFILINWFILKSPIAIYLGNNNYNAIGNWNDLFTINSIEYGFDQSVRITNALGDSHILKVNQLEELARSFAKTNAKIINNWINNIDKEDLINIHHLMDKNIPTLIGQNDIKNSLLYILNNDFKFDDIKYKFELISNLPNNLYSYNGICFDPRGVVIYTTKWYTIGVGAFTKSLNVAIKVMLIICSSIILTSTTTPSELTNGIEKIFSPLKIIKFPASECALILSIGIRFIPSLLSESRRILNAQASRGLDFYNGNLWVKLKALVSVIIPLFSISINRSGELANAMDARGYNPRAYRTKYRVFGMNAIDFIYLTCISFLIFFLIFLWSFNFLFMPFGIIEAGLVL